MTGGMLTVAEAAAEVRVSRMTVYRLCESGELAHLRVGRSIRIPREAWDAWVASRRA